MSTRLARKYASEMATPYNSLKMSTAGSTQHVPASVSKFFSRCHYRTAPLQSEKRKLKSMPSCFITMHAPHVMDEETRMHQIIQYQSFMVTAKKLYTCCRTM